jgi:hypothetical protein
MYSPLLFTVASQRSGRFSIPRLKKSAGLSVNRSPSKFWSSASLLKETPRRADCWRESGRGGNPMGQSQESRANWKNPPVEFLNGRFRHVCIVWSGVVMLKNHSMSSTRAYLLDCFLQTAKLLTIAFDSNGQVPLKQFIMDNPLHIPPDAAPSAECHSCQNCLA